MTTKGFKLCTPCKDRLAAMKRQQSVECLAQTSLGGWCRRKTTHPSAVCVQHRRS